MKYSIFSERGVRRYNQDICRVVEMPGHGRSLFVLCDGMGGHDMGDVAAETVCDAWCGYWTGHTAVADSEEKVRDACSKVWRALYERSVRVRPIEMGTTLVMASIEGNRVTIAHCGDSRCYVLRKGRVLHQTKDHIGQHNGWEVVTRCFFSQQPELAVPDVTTFSLQAGDRLFLCSDGVYKFVHEETIMEYLSGEQSQEVVVERIKHVCEQGSRDNYSGILVDVGDMD